ncbi:MAG: reverse transcriptase/maturase family protein [Patescibacteria group bacterium]
MPVISKASVRDRVVHRLVYNALYYYFDYKFIYDSYSCRIGKGTHKAQARFRSFVNKVSKNYTASCFVLKFDIKKCFESIDKNILKNILSFHIEDKGLKRIIFSIIDSFGTGIPLGNLTSQLFLNIYLHELDWYVKQFWGCKYYLRYADDIIIISTNKEKLEELYANLEIFLKNKLNLTTHKKIIISIYSGIDILGLVFFPQYQRLRRSTERRIEKRNSKIFKHHLYHYSME